ncbi:hypothetical protein K8Q96_01795 [Candidatus Nomurabacteria bacterium]|nr:hypothetical protein [Candidatus Nomurabacteria bacterium]
MQNSLIKIPLIVIGFAIVFSIIWSIYRPAPMSPTVTPITSNTDTENSKDSNTMCYYRADKTKRGLYDRYYVILNIEGNKITGEFKNLPAEKDSKVGTFEGVIENQNELSVSNIATLWWNSLAEGMNNKEELVIVYDENSAKVGFGEMIEQADKTFVYKDKSNITYGNIINKIDCKILDQMAFIEKYIQDNIKTIATNQPVLGGSWYTTNVVADIEKSTANVTYEDGHVQSKGLVEYTFDKEKGTITIIKFTVIK